jgi:hypothetical protein
MRILGGDVGFQPFGRLQLAKERLFRVALPAAGPWPRELLQHNSKDDDESELRFEIANPEGGMVRRSLI